MTKIFSPLCSGILMWMAVYNVFVVNADEKKVFLSGIHPHLAMYNLEGECGVGAVVPWADRLWVITYSPHFPYGSTDKFYEITPDLEQIVRGESVGGTHANRMIHRETNQLIIGPYLVDADRRVRVISPRIMPGRLTGTVRHLTDPAEKVYFATMEEGLYEVDIKTLEVNCLLRDDNPFLKRMVPEQLLSIPKSKLPGSHGKGLYTGQGRVVYSNNGDSINEIRYSMTLPSGALAEWSGEGDWSMVRRTQFTDVTGPGGIYGNVDPENDPVWTIGWDYRSLVLMALDGGRWNSYRLPKTSHTYDGGHGWHTEWPRIRDVGEESLLMTMHGMFWKFPKTFSSGNSSGIVPRSSFLKIMSDFCRWKDRIVFGCNDVAMTEAANKRNVKGDLGPPGCSHSNLWFIDPRELDTFGPVLGRGGVWIEDSVKAGVVSDPYLFSGYENRMLYLRHGGEETVSIDLEIDEKGNDDWKPFKNVPVPAGSKGSVIRFSPEDRGTWIRLKSDKDVDGVSAMFHYRGNDPRGFVPGKRFRGLAEVGGMNPEEAAKSRHGRKADGSKSVHGAIMLTRDMNEKTLRLLFCDESGEEALYDLDGDLRLRKVSDPDGFQGTSWMKENAGVPTDVAIVDEASVLIVDDKGQRWRFPKGSPERDKPGPLGEERLCREVVTQRDLFQLHGTFYELPRDSSGGFQWIRPIASHPFHIKDYAPFRGLVVLSGLSTDVPDDNPHIVKSDDGKFAVWCGVIDDLWELGKPRGVGGPWKNFKVEANRASDPYLTTGYDKKRAVFSHDAKETVAFRIELDISGSGLWTHWQTIEVAPGESKELDVDVDAYWVRIVSNKSTTASATFFYE